MKAIVVALVLFVSVCFGDYLQVQTTSGPIEGFNNNGINAFLGIPYAKPPVGPLRWKPPQPPTPWSNVLPTQTFSSACVQLNTPNVIQSYAFPPNVIFSEDCLYLNVWAPNDTTPNKPVMVWIHGGGFHQGGNSQYTFRGENLASNGSLVVVNINYRLGLLGFLYHDFLSKEDPNYPSSGNYGLLDQRLALQWVKDNIANFGGDPNQVTIFGESAGGSSVAYHLVMPRSDGLFSKAIIQSGAVFVETRPLSDSIIFGNSIQEKVNCSGNDPQTVLECMRSVDPMTIYLAEGSVVTSTVTIDGYEFLTHPYLSFLRGNYTKVPLLTGFVKNEGTIFVRSYPTPMSKAQYSNILQSQFLQFAPSVNMMYPCENYNASDCWFALSYAIGDFSILCPTKFIADTNAANSEGTLSYLFNHKPSWINTQPPLGVFHSSEIGFVFSTLNLYANPTPEENGLALTMTNLWANFATSGTNISWPIYNSPNYTSLVLDINTSEVDDYEGPLCNFWGNLYRFLYQ